AKWRALGWFQLGRCPVALAMAGELSFEHLDESLRKATPCEPGTYSEKKPCKHTLLEVAGRQRVQGEEMASRLPKLKRLDEQLAEANKAQAQNNQELVAGLAGAFKEAL